MNRRTGTAPRRTIKHKKTLSDGSIVDYEMPCCDLCDQELPEVATIVLHHWHPSFDHIRKYPFPEAIYYCAACKKSEGFEEIDYLLVPYPKGFYAVEALKAHIAAIEAAAGGGHES